MCILFRLKTGNSSDESAALGMNNFVDGGGDLTYTEVNPIWDTIYCLIIIKT